MNHCFISCSCGMIIGLVELLTNEEMSNSEPTDVVLDLN